MNYKIHYGQVDNYGDTEEIKFKSSIEVMNWVQKNILTPEKKTVYVIAVSDEIVVTNNKALIAQIFSKDIPSVYPYYEGSNIFIFEYKSFEAAYDIALNMQEENNPDCCYAEPDHIPPDVMSQLLNN